jgi:hypothetical protein
LEFNRAHVHHEDQMTDQWKEHKLLIQDLIRKWTPLAPPSSTGSNRATNQECTGR